MNASVQALIRRAEFSTPLAEDPTAQVRLAHWNRQRLAPRAPDADWRAALAAEFDMRRLETEFIEQTRRLWVLRAAEAPQTPDAFVVWFEDLEHGGPGQHDALFPWLAAKASRDEMRWFLEQEVAGEAGFDDLVALAQIKTPTQVKLELARNFWDEMGRGAAKGMHGPMLDHLAKALNIAPRIETTLTPALALGNTMIALASNRAFAFHALGALGIIELTAPGRASQVAAGLKRLGVRADDRHYFDLHAVLDIKHSAAWNREVFKPLIAERPECARFIAEGALMRLACGEACFKAYRAHLWGAENAPAPN
jgi:hypothetical protein